MTIRWPGDTLLNADVRWSAFDPIAYVDHNYRDLQAEDAEILQILRDHFGGHFAGRADGPVSGIDVGAGANLYPGLAMLPWCDEITLFERSSANVRYLKSQVASYDANWDQFWRVLCKNEVYAALDIDPRAKFRTAVRVEEGNLFELVAHEGQWSMGTMFFVAESMTTSREEFTRGVECFLRALRPGAPFAAAFMEHSKGYHAGKHFFPACDVGESEVYESLAPFADEFTTTRLKASAAVREGYSGMIVAYGHRNSNFRIQGG
ncbi:SCO2525 family SAM-dependent methyltransferase [Streptomyces sp. RY43-2]|uniref:SCO2525 family SAM-dependent methyltransferase n=1 Tax=Streptomyces macrolidinus TaxID=2952607 RepID=A0ABT0Z701_9ACTN|nr:SCO2525 family SAM-dependent methyltransferase [Streptomyces macrolidinus]MCN9239543.1 SCO2525 family SAM-dependent methyltransferase [Streptomyces macrolidinus]